MLRRCSKKIETNLKGGGQVELSIIAVGHVYGPNRGYTNHRLLQDLHVSSSRHSLLVTVVARQLPTMARAAIKSDPPCGLASAVQKLPIDFRSREMKIAVLALILVASP